MEGTYPSKLLFSLSRFLNKTLNFWISTQMPRINNKSLLLDDNQAEAKPICKVQVQGVRSSNNNRILTKVTRWYHKEQRLNMKEEIISIRQITYSSPLVQNYIQRVHRGPRNCKIVRLHWGWGRVSIAIIRIKDTGHLGGIRRHMLTWSSKTKTSNSC